MQNKKKDTGAMSDFLFRDTFKASGFKLVAEVCHCLETRTPLSFCHLFCFDFVVYNWHLVPIFRDPCTIQVCRL